MKRLLIAVFFLFFLGNVAFSADMPFTDVKTSDSYYDALSYLYKNDVIRDNGDHLFKPNGLVPRDEFVSIIVGSGCKKCLYPSALDIAKYSSFPFLDVEKLNPYFYCISYAKDVGIVKGYIVDQTGKTSCQNGQSFTESPFCPANNIERIEAVGALLRQANIWTEALNSSSYEKTITIADVDVYWYGYAQKGIAAGILKIDKEGKVYPHQYITRKELVEMAWKIYSLNQCQWLPSDQNQNNQTGSGLTNSGVTNSGSGITSNTGVTSGTGVNDLTADIQVFDPNNPGSCTGKGAETTFPDPYSSVYDFYAKTESVGDLEYFWEFTNTVTGEVIKKTGKCLDNFDLKTSGKWIVKLTVRDINTKKEAVSITTIDIKKRGDEKKCSDLSADIIPNPLVGYAPLTDNFTSIVKSACGGPYTYHWDFGDGGSSTNPNPSHIFQNPGVYVVTLHVRDSNGNIAISQVVIQVKKIEDRDHDGILDSDDKCLDVFGLLAYNGCPKIDVFVLKYDSILDTCLRKRAESTGGFFLGQGTCTHCPCEGTLDYLAAVRACDIIFPAITSPSKKTIYGRGNIWQMKE